MGQASATSMGALPTTANARRIPNSREALALIGCASTAWATGTDAPDVIEAAVSPGSRLGSDRTERCPMWTILVYRPHHVAGRGHRRRSCPATPGRTRNGQRATDTGLPARVDDHRGEPFRRGHRLRRSSRLLPTRSRSHRDVGVGPVWRSTSSGPVAEYARVAALVAAVIRRSGPPTRCARASRSRSLNTDAHVLERSAA